jgi:hypothetical protein
MPSSRMQHYHQNRYGMRRHFLFRHYLDTIVILEERQLPHYDKCGMFCTLTALAGKHFESAICGEGTQTNKQKMRELQCIRALHHTFHILDQEPLETVTNFWYLGRIWTLRDNDWAATWSNLQKVIKWWAMISHVLICKSASPRISALFYKAPMIQTVLLYGSETWVMTDEILQMLTSFHHEIAWCLTGRYPHPISDTNDEWIYPSIQETLHIAGLFTMEEYLNWQWNWDASSGGIKHWPTQDNHHKRTQTQTHNIPKTRPKQPASPGILCFF